MTLAPAASQSFQRSRRLPHVEMRQAGHAAACYQPHTHDEFSVGVVDAGSAVYRNRHRQDALYPGMLVMVNPGDTHSCNATVGQSWSYRMLFIDTPWLARLQADSLPLAGRDYAAFATHSSAQPLLYRRFDRLFQTLAQDADGLAAEEQLVCFLMDCFDAPAPRLDGGPPGAALQRARALILDQLADKLTLEAIAHEARLSPFHLIRSFKQAYGQTPHAFQLDQRINRGKQLLKQGQGLADVALQLGFADQSHFQRHFKSRHAVTPQAYQRALAAA
ncbi:AraC-type DNA-binding protein [Rhodoferax sp. OV413]|uniref:AraC family transcriptional regulator n=1 Tax=Rhodoferax sp. OV413 TaxID=1855285 RepID=UPI00088F0B5A|nr:AraC family transcriptional regulator [Rhodoferax sp. OV413]SDP88313.1 AraC-type DNA-binding protein [Rhodoferax sp. OV413]